MLGWHFFSTRNILAFRLSSNLIKTLLPAEMDCNWKKLSTKCKKNLFSNTCKARWAKITGAAFETHSFFPFLRYTLFSFCLRPTLFFFFEIHFFFLFVWDPLWLQIEEPAAITTSSFIQGLKCLAWHGSFERGLGAVHCLFKEEPEIDYGGM